MDALELLKNDHQRVKSLFEQFEGESGRQQQILLFDNIRNELEAHASIEETIFYPAFRNYPGLGEIIERSFEEHQEVKALLSEIDQLPNDSQELETKVKALMESVEKHVEEEENELFPKVRKIMRSGDRERIGRLMQAAKPMGPGIAA